MSRKRHQLYPAQFLCHKMPLTDKDGILSLLFEDLLKAAIESETNFHMDSEERVTGNC